MATAQKETLTGVGIPVSVLNSMHCESRLAGIGRWDLRAQTRFLGTDLWQIYSQRLPIREV